MRRLIKIRKQNDDVKLIMLFVLAGIVFLACAIYNGIQFYRLVNTPVEYVLTYASGNVLSDIKLEELAQSENVCSVSRQVEKSALIKYNMYETSFSYVELSAAYMEAVYGIEESGSMKTFYMNEPAYEQLLQSTQGVEDRTEQEFTIRYALSSEQTDESNTAAMSYKTARVVVIRDGVTGDVPYIFCKGSSIDMGQNTVCVRVWYRQHDFDGMNRKRLEALGFIVEDENSLIEADYGLKLVLFKLRYEALLSVICMGGAIGMGRSVRRILFTDNSEKEKT